MQSVQRYVRPTKYQPRMTILQFVRELSLLRSVDDVPVVEVDHLVIGGGVVGLAVAARLQRMATPSFFHSSYSSSSSPLRPTSTANTNGKSTRLSVLLVDKNAYLGEEASSRNSEVIHAGLYYPNESWKTRLCVRGKHLLYDYCRKRGIAHRQCGKWIVSSLPKGASSSDVSTTTTTTTTMHLSESQGILLLSIYVIIRIYSNH